MVDLNGRPNELPKGRGKPSRQFLIVHLIACLLAGLALLGVGGLSSGQHPVKASAGRAPTTATVVACSVTPAQITVGKSATFSVTVTDVTNLNGFDIQMTFDSTGPVQFQDMDPTGRTGINLRLGSFLDLDKQFVVFNTVIPATGKIHVALVVTGAPSSGSGQLFSGALTGVNPGTVHFSFDSAELTEWPNANLISNQTAGCSLVVDPAVEPVKLMTYIPLVQR